MKLDEISREVQSLMASNRVVSCGYRYTRPAPSIYEQQWLWDSCFHAIIYSHFDPDMAKDELRSLLYHRGVDTGGMVPHMVYWTGGGKELWGNEYVSFITQPPMIADTALLIYEATNDTGFLQEIFEPMVNYYNWLLSERDHDGDYLLSIIHPWESGWDASPRWDEELGLNNPASDETKQARFSLAGQLKKLGQNMNIISSLGLFHVESVDFNAIYVANVWALAQIAKLVGQSDQQIHFETVAQKVKEAVNKKMWNESDGFYWDLAGNDEKPVKIPTPASFVTLFAQIPSKPQVERLVNQLRTRFLSTYPVPTVALDYPGFAADQYWRGSTWLNVNWFIVRGLQIYGYTDIAELIVEQSRKLVQQEGFREYYNPLTGRGLGSKAHSWSGIVLDMLHRVQASST